MSLTPSVDQIAANTIAAMLAGISDLAGVSIFVGDSAAAQGVTSRVVVEAQEQGDNFSVKYGGTYAKNVGISVIVRHQAPEGDPTLPGKYANAIAANLDNDALAAALFAAVPDETKSLLDVFILEQDPEGSREVDNDLFTKQLAYLATVHKVVS
jgi:hypothetical protein